MNKFQDNQDGTITSLTTGLMWQKETPKAAMLWEEALQYCENLNLSNFKDWRLPTIEELLTLVDYRQYNPTIDKAYFPDTQSSFYWSSTTGAYDTSYAWGVVFYVGNGHGSDKSDRYYVRAVRGEIQ